MQNSAQTQQRRTFEPGAEYREVDDRIWVDLRAGEIAVTSKTQIDETFIKRKSENKAGEVFEFYAQPYHHITGYVTALKWKSQTFENGGVKTGWNVMIDAVGQKYGLFVASNDRPYHYFMNCLLNVDFDVPVFFRGYTDEYKGKKQKALLISQEKNEENKPIWLQPKHPERWMSLMLREIIRNGDPIPENEKRNVEFKEDGVTADNAYPYVLQKQDQKWSFDAWDDFLITKMKEEVIPAIERANEIRGIAAREEEGMNTDIAPEDRPPAAPAGAYADDDIPF
ncbi:MAG: hypothetical protein ABL984_06935 [Pyrinomonadaceae bacterium]